MENLEVSDILSSASLAELSLTELVGDADISPPFTPKKPNLQHPISEFLVWKFGYVIFCLRYPYF